MQSRVIATRDDAERVASPMPGAAERMTHLRTRYGQLTSSIAYQESRLSKQAAELEQINRPKGSDEDLFHDDGHELGPGGEGETSGVAPVSRAQANDFDMKQELEEIQELERKKRGLEERVSGMERDLGGLLR